MKEKTKKEREKKVKKVAKTKIKSLSVKGKELKAVELGDSPWEKNHIKIIEAMYTLIKDKSRTTLPRVVEIAQFTGLSKPTVSTHLKAYRQSVKGAQRHKEALDDYTELVLLNALRLSKHSVPAQRLLLECAGFLDPQQNVTNNNTVNAINISLSEDE